MAKMRLFNDQGKRLYVTPEEREQFIHFAKQEDRESRTYCRMIKETGIRPVEADQLTVSSIDLSLKGVIVKCAKKRSATPIYRMIPLSDDFLDELNLVHNIKKKQSSKRGRTTQLWSWSIRTGRRKVQAVMSRAGITGEMANPRGLRHGFGVACVMKNIPLPTLQKWMGHADLETTAIYTQIIGAEERELACRLWE